MSALLIKLSGCLFGLSVAGAVIGVVMALLIAPTEVETQDDEDERAQKRRY
ncbi:hypothetical protein [Ralstonia pickettii]|uniref:hypothetical protein n=1 Tax=Ralstonia pickettii TaxID=329 RepID=UPI0015F9FF1A|nr:hypothetical protein [Ralstonia pickettii]MBX4001190.1 hypothetical protein [Ralstonia pickettii]MBX4069624.1 hypothetical protein [Ralstonia pickettii]MBX4074742.1 hypothetical protein [Ralstonia pickettii]MBX4087582.1 hypothetical protein [Ralstonia pickettii]MBX4096796.1 hypothetical protein [Ralstonia pickettii]